MAKKAPAFGQHPQNLDSVEFKSHRLGCLMEENLRQSIIPSKACSLLTTLNDSTVKDTLKCAVCQGKLCE